MENKIVNPDYYKAQGIDCLDVMEMVYGGKATYDFCIGNAFKYVWRCNQKHETPVDDIQKAMVYLERALTLLNYDEEKANGGIK